jgi:hypothetical protein
MAEELTLQQKRENERLDCLVYRTICWAASLGTFLPAVGLILFWYLMPHLVTQDGVRAILIIDSLLLFLTVFLGGCARANGQHARRLSGQKRWDE